MSLKQRIAKLELKLFPPNYDKKHVAVHQYVAGDGNMVFCSARTIGCPTLPCKFCDECLQVSEGSVLFIEDIKQAFRDSLKKC